MAGFGNFWQSTQNFFKPFSNWIQRLFLPSPSQAINSRDIESCRKLLKLGANFDNTRDDYNNTIVHVATIMNDEGMLADLKKRGFDLNLKNSLEETPLEIATSRGKATTVQKLLGLGANYKIANKEGKIPLEVAISKQNLETTTILLKEYGENFRYLIDVDKIWHALLLGKSYPKEMLELLLSRGLHIDDKINLPDQTEDQRLLHLVARSKANTLEYVLGLGPNLNVINKEGETPLYLTIPDYRDIHYKDLVQDNLQKFKLLLSKGANVNQEVLDSKDLLKKVLDAQIAYNDTSSNYFKYSFLEGFILLLKEGFNVKEEHILHLINHHVDLLEKYSTSQNLDLSNLIKRSNIGFILSVLKEHLAQSQTLDSAKLTKQIEEVLKNVNKGILKDLKALEQLSLDKSNDLMPFAQILLKEFRSHIQKMSSDHIHTQYKQDPLIKNGYLEKLLTEIDSPQALKATGILLHRQTKKTPEEYELKEKGMPQTMAETNIYDAPTIGAFADTIMPNITKYLNIGEMASGASVAKADLPKRIKKPPLPKINPQISLEASGSGELTEGPKSPKSQAAKLGQKSPKSPKDHTARQTEESGPNNPGRT